VKKTLAYCGRLQTPAAALRDVKSVLLRTPGGGLATALDIFTSSEYRKAWQKRAGWRLHVAA